VQADLELILVHDGERWIAREGAHEAALVSAGRTLPELDRNLAAELRRRGHFAGACVTVFMGFDFATIPTWLRQYASHYFNRYVTLDLSQPAAEPDDDPGP